LGFRDNWLVVSSDIQPQLEHIVDVDEAAYTVASVQEDWGTLVAVDP
jgi:hypothetical protein